MNTLTDWNPDDFLDHKQSEADKALAVRFFYKPVQDKVATLAEGRPIFAEVPYIDIRIPGERDSAACRPATQADVKRFPEHYRAFKNRTNEEVVGTPLCEWPLITRSQAEELSFFNVKTVEQLAGMPDSGNHQFRGINVIKAKAVEWLAENQDKQALQAEFDRREQALKTQLAEQNEKIAELLEKVAGLSPLVHQAQKPKARSKAKPKAKKETVNVVDTDRDR